MKMICTYIFIQYIFLNIMITYTNNNVNFLSTLSIACYTPLTTYYINSYCLEQSSLLHVVKQTHISACFFPQHSYITNRNVFINIIKRNEEDR